MATTGTTPQAIAAAAQCHARGAPTRRAVVTVAVVNMTPTANRESQIERTTAVMTRATTPSCTIARTPATTASRSRSMRPRRLATTVTASSTTRATATGQPGEMSTAPP